MDKQYRAYLQQQFDGVVYVYAYIDPWTDEPFFIGQGTGEWDTEHLMRRNTPFYQRVRDIRAYGLNPVVIRLLTTLTRREASAAVRFFLLSIGCQCFDRNPGPLLNRHPRLPGVQCGRGITQTDRIGRKTWIVTFYSTRIGEASTYEEAVAIRQAEEKRAAGLSRRAWEKKWKELRTARRVSR